MWPWLARQLQLAEAVADSGAKVGVATVEAAGAGAEERARTVDCGSGLNLMRT